MYTSTMLKFFFLAGFEVFEVLPPSGQIKVIIAALNEASSCRM